MQRDEMTLTAHGPSGRLTFQINGVPLATRPAAHGPASCKGAVLDAKQLEFDLDQHGTLGKG